MIPLHAIDDSTHLEHSSDLQSDLLAFTQRRLADQLYNLCQVLLLLQDLPNSGTKLDEAGIVFLIMRIEDFDVFRV